MMRAIVIAAPLLIAGCSRYEVIPNPQSGGEPPLYRLDTWTGQICPAWRNEDGKLFFSECSVEGQWQAFPGADAPQPDTSPAEVND